MRETVEQRTYVCKRKKERKNEREREREEGRFSGYNSSFLNVEITSFASQSFA